MNSSFYDIYKPYEENYDQGPIGIKKLKKPVFTTASRSHRFLGHSISLRFGIPAGTLLNSKYVKQAFDFGFAVSTYKTVRSYAFPCHPYPNVVYVDAPRKLDPEKVKRVKIKRSGGLLSQITITNSFGVPSKNPDFWQKDVKKALSYQKKGQLLILSFMGTVKKNQTKKEFITDFALTGKFSYETRVKVLEVNLSCPNIGNEGLVCFDLNITAQILKAIRKAIDNTPLLVKVTYYKNNADVEKLSAIVNEYANGISAINTIQVGIVDKNGKQALPGHNRLKSGVAGAAIKWAGLEMVKKLNKIRQKKNYKFEIVGIGGVLTPQDYFDYKNAGADVVQSATGTMWNPYLAYEIWKEENKI